MKHRPGIAALVLFNILCFACAAVAARDGFEIDLKELRPAPADAAKPRQRDTSRPAPPTQVIRSKGGSSYVVKPGDHLFLILVRHYRLANDAAERLIPEVMRLNGISDPRRLTVGQRLTIPLPSPPDARPKGAAQKAPYPQPAPAEAAPLQTPADTGERQVTNSPCPLARTVVEQLGLQIPLIKPQPNAASFAAGNAGLKLVVACDLSAAEAYTYGRLLAHSGAQLLAFRGDEPPRRVIEELAGQLGLSFRLEDPAAMDDLPLTYVFPAEGAGGKDLRLTIRPAVEEAAPPGR